MWYLLGDNPSVVYCGLQPNTTQEQFLDAVENNTSEKLLQQIPVRKDSAIFVRGGHVHAIDSGCLILEIQQSSNTTYRIYDWGRMGTDGTPVNFTSKKPSKLSTGRIPPEPPRRTDLPFQNRHPRTVASYNLRLFSSR